MDYTSNRCPACKEVLPGRITYPAGEKPKCPYCQANLPYSDDPNAVPQIDAPQMTHAEAKQEWERQKATGVASATVMIVCIIAFFLPPIGFLVAWLMRNHNDNASVGGMIAAFAGTLAWLVIGGFFLLAWFGLV